MKLMKNKNMPEEKGIIPQEIKFDFGNSSGKLPGSVFEFTDNCEDLISAGLNWGDQAFADSYKINLRLAQPAVLPL